MAIFWFAFVVFLLGIPRLYLQQRRGEDCSGAYFQLFVSGTLILLPVIRTINF